MGRKDKAKATRPFKKPGTRFMKNAPPAELYLSTFHSLNRPLPR